MLQPSLNEKLSTNVNVYQRQLAGEVLGPLITVSFQ